MLSPRPTASSPGARRHSLMQGESEVSRDPELVLTTILGSCIACCLYDPFARVGGMNHFLLPQPPKSAQVSHGAVERYGLYAMEVLVNEMLKAGATRASMRAHLYGGANLHMGMRSIGTENERFARSFLSADGITLAHADTGGTSARRLEFQPASGRIRCRQVQDVVPETPRTVPKVKCGEVELF